MYFKTLVVTVAIMFLTFLWTLWQPIAVDLDVINTFFEIFGVAYAIIVGFAMLHVSENYNRFRQRLYAEIDDLQDLRDYLLYVDNQDDLVAEIKATIRKYVEHVLNVEWPAMTGHRELEMDTPAPIYDVMRSINKIRRTNESDEVALERLVTTVAEITTHRMERLHASRESLPAPFLHLIVMLSFFLLFAFSLIPITHPADRLLLSGILTLSTVLILFVILDIADPFRGVWRIGPDGFRNLLKRL